jgi:hypothetical protein
VRVLAAIRRAAPRRSLAVVAAAARRWLHRASD